MMTIEMGGTKTYTYCGGNTTNAGTYTTLSLIWILVQSTRTKKQLKIWQRERDLFWPEWNIP